MGGAHARPLKVVIACPGLGISNRGFESFAQECFDALEARPELELTLVKGAGPAGGNVHRVPTLHRDWPLTRMIAWLLRRPDFVVEQWSFAVAFAPLLWRLDPDVVFYSEWSLGTALGRWRRLARRRFRLLLSNGAAGWPPFDRAVDHVQQLTPSGLRVALDGGEPSSRHTLLPLGQWIPAARGFPDAGERTAVRKRLGLPVDRTILLCVAAINDTHKRCSYLVEEVAGLPAPRPHLVLLGQYEPETPSILKRARDRLGPDGFTAREVSPAEVGAFYSAADAFVLASTTEGFGRVYLEALGHGLPVLTHGYPTTEYVLGPHGRTADLRRAGALTALLAGLDPAADLDDHRRAERHSWVREHFGWDARATDYVEMFRRTAAP